ncbi:MAG: hypothetical protein JW966_16615 [Anaerolineae bacterium]|nr:hypothetical protein [Anaerolineae bacterium]
MNTVMLEQSVSYLTRRVHSWERRLRVARSALWVPRGIILGLVISVFVAGLARLRPWLLPEQLVMIAAALIALGGLSILAAIWLLPQVTLKAARHFDRRFALKERVSTALELTQGTIPFPEPLAEYQLSDAVHSAQHVNLSTLLPIRVRAKEIVLLLLLAGLLVYLLLADNPYVDKLRAEREWQNTINSQITELEEEIEAIEANESLSEAEQNALTQPLEQAIDILEQPNVSQQEAVAALAEAGQSLENASDGMLPDQQNAYQDAASQLADSDTTSGLSEALDKPNLGEAANALDDLAEDIAAEDLSEADRETLAEQLEQAADALENTNPALADKLREAAEALRNGDMAAAQQALREAAELLQEQQEQLENSPLAQAAQTAAQQTDQSQQNIAQADQEQTENPSGEMESAGPEQSAPLDQQANSQQGKLNGEQPGSSQQEAEAGANSQQAQSGDAAQQAEGEQQAGAEPGQSGNQQNSTGDDGSQGQGTSQNETDSAAGQGLINSSESDQPSDQAGVVDMQGESSDATSLNAGLGAGGEGVDDTTGVEGDANGDVPPNNASSEGELQDYSSGYAPSNIGGQSSDIVDVGGDNADLENAPLQEGEFGPNPEGESTLSYTNVYNDYQDAVSDALESGRIPLDQRDVIHDYFSSLEP